MTYHVMLDGDNGFFIQTRFSVGLDGRCDVFSLFFILWYNIIIVFNLNGTTIFTLTANKHNVHPNSHLHMYILDST